MKEFDKKKIEEIKERTRPVDASPLIKAILSGDKMSVDERKEFLHVILKGFKRTGELLLDRAFIEGLMTEKEYLELKKKYNLVEEDYAVILQAYFNRKDGLCDDDDGFVVVTTPDSNVFKCRDFIKKRFNVDVKSPKECIELIKEERKRELKNVKTN